MIITGTGCLRRRGLPRCWPRVPKPAMRNAETLNAHYDRGLGESVSRAGERVVDQPLNIQPTIQAAAGTPVRILMTRVLVLKPLEAGGRP